MKKKRNRGFLSFGEAPLEHISDFIADFYFNLVKD